MPTPHNDARSDARSDVQSAAPTKQESDERNLAKLRQEAEMLRARQQRDFARFQVELSAEIAAARAALAEVIPAETGLSDDAAATPAIQQTGRRTLLKWGGLGVAATLAAAGGVTLAPLTAHASDGAHLTLGSSGNQAEHTTAIAYDGGEANPVVVRVTTTASNSTALTANAGAASASAPSGVSGSGGTNGRGVRGSANGTRAFGIWGTSGNGFGVVGESSTGIDLAAAGTGRLLQASSGSVGAPSSGSYAMGAQIRDAVGNLYICVASGSPGVWQKVVGRPVGYRSGSISFLPTPIRVYDSRPGNHPLVGNGVRNVQVTGVNIGGVQVPAGASGCVGNLTVVRPTTGGYLVIYPQGSPTPSSSTVNYVAYQTIPNSFWVGLSGGGQVTVHAFQSGSCQFIVDITGYIS